ncbi:hypothetical protein OG204_21330 [Streptomyces sp. NBC_01387]|uniref:hypothetical protein n=1 Tax=unclassified Streptomyces TaxID=2593676 RepID=UPI0020246878|nr:MULTISPECIES: hypothetical protein [unclassified Streptomyces]WSC24619.1 hypothetical protein OIE60_13985 [Streptomyces sp. NBC_01766]
MAFSADELRVLRRALAIALNPTPVADEDIQDCLRLAESVDEAIGETGRLRAFLLADLARYRDALPGAARSYTELLQDALAAGYDPRAEDLAALRTLRDLPSGDALLRRCRALAERSVQAGLAGRTATPGQRTRLLALPGGRKEGEPVQPKRPAPDGVPAPPRPAPKPSEVFPPRRKPAAPPAQRFAVG